MNKKWEWWKIKIHKKNMEGLFGKFSIVLILNNFLFLKTGQWTRNGNDEKLKFTKKNMEGLFGRFSIVLILNKICSTC